MRTPPSECPGTKPGLERPSAFRCHRLKIFWHTAAFMAARKRKRRAPAALLPPQAGHAASVPSSPGFDNGSVNEIFWYGTFGMIEPRAPWLS
jgi:hypothetical protein